MNTKRTRASYRKKKTRELVNRLLIGAFVILGLALLGIVITVNWQPKQNNSESTFEVQDFGYEQIRDDGSLTQKLDLLHELKSKRLTPGLIPVNLDTNRKIVEISDSIIAHPDRSEADRGFAVQSKLNALATSYHLDITNGLNDPFIAEQLVGTSEQYLSDENIQVSREAHIIRANALATETINKRFLGGVDRVEEALVRLVSTFPDDPVVLSQVKTLFTMIRSFNGEASAKIATRVAAITDQSDSADAMELSRFMKDIIVLFDSGIGNFRRIENVIVDNSDFMQRMNALNDDLETGVTVVKQLENGIEFFERQGEYDLAMELSQNVLKNSESRQNPAAAALAKDVGERGIQRNSLIGNRWKFGGLDYFGDEIDPKRFTDRVVLIVFYPLGQPQTVRFAHRMMQIASRFAGRAVDIIMVEIGDKDQPSLAAENRDYWIPVRSLVDKPGNYWQQCPTHNYPYIVLIDKDGNVDSINIAFDTIKTQIEEQLSRK